MQLCPGAAGALYDRCPVPCPGLSVAFQEPRSPQFSSHRHFLVPCHHIRVCEILSSFRTLENIFLFWWHLRAFWCLCVALVMLLSLDAVHRQNVCDIREREKEIQTLLHILVTKGSPSVKKHSIHNRVTRISCSSSKNAVNTALSSGSRSACYSTYSSEY